MADQTSGFTLDFASSCHTISCKSGDDKSHSSAPKHCFETLSAPVKASASASNNVIIDLHSMLENITSNIVVSRRSKWKHINQQKAYYFHLCLWLHIVSECKYDNVSHTLSLLAVTCSKFIPCLFFPVETFAVVDGQTFSYILNRSG